MAEIVVENAIKKFGKFFAIDDVTLTIHDKEFMVLLGPSGCGKTTLLRAIAGLGMLDDGRIMIGDRDVTYLSPKERNVSMVFQNYAIFPHMTVFDNIAFGLKMRKTAKNVILERVNTAATLLHIENMLERFPGAMSGGQRQRVAVARAIAYDAEVLLMDEPLSNLDALLRLEMRAELKALLARLGMTTVYVTHDQIEALSMGDRIAVMRAGKILQVDNPTLVYDMPADQFVGSFIGNPPMNFIPATRANGRWQVAGLSFDGPAAGDKLEFAIRPEDLTVAPGGLKAIARVVEPLGAHTLVTCEVNGALFRAVLESDLKVAPGDELSLVPKPDRIRWFDP
ncbi:MAG: ABC transporter ATP-binding protein, partial [Burkholderiales bacterium]|nr:ABC transporter ATP-binding protein [Anaerolineae bacterium]